MTEGMTTNFAESAAWPDDIKDNGAHYWDIWHFINKPINWEGMGIDNPVKS